MKKIIHILLAGFLLLIYSCGAKKSGGGSIFQKENVNVDLFSKSLYSLLKPVDTADSNLNKKLLNDQNLNLDFAYQLNRYKPFWFNHKGLNIAGKSLPDQLNELQDEGLNPEDYHVSKIQNILQKVGKDDVYNMDSIEQWDIFMTKCYLDASKDLLLGKDRSVLDSNWHLKNDSIFDAARVLANFSLNHDTSIAPVLLQSFRPQNKVYTAMLNGVIFWKKMEVDTNYITLKQHFNFKNDSITNYILKLELGQPNAHDYDEDSFSNYIALYQNEHQIKKSGKLNAATIASLKQLPKDYIQKLIWNMKRMQYMPRDFGNDFVWVNIPAMRMQYIRNKDVAFECKAIVGKTVRQTPCFNAMMTNVVINPPWVIPPTILKKDVANGIMKSGPAYLRKKGFHAINVKGEDVTPSVTASNYKHFSYKQMPGPLNALGTIKFNLPNPYSIYLHDTPHKNGFSADFRAMSSGCVRLGKPFEFAAFLLGKQDYDSAKIEGIIQTRITKTVNLKKRIPIYIVYLTNGINDSGKLVYLDDIYKIQYQTADKKIKNN